MPILRIAAQLWNQVISRQELGGRLRTGYFYQFEDVSLYEDVFQVDELFSRIALDTTDTDDRVKLLMKALTKLSPHQREIIYLYYVNELGHNEIAGILGINYQSSKNLLSRTLRKLRRWFSLEL